MCVCVGRVVSTSQWLLAECELILLHVRTLMCVHVYVHVRVCVCM